MSCPNDCQRKHSGTKPLCTCYPDHFKEGEPTACQKKPTKNKETILSVLQDIRALLQSKEAPLTETTKSENYFILTDGPGLKTSELLQKCKDKFDVYCFYSAAKLDEGFLQPIAKTTRKFKKTVEADPELAGMSAQDLMEKGINGITLRERLIMELQYFEETGQHLDVDNVTLCSGSRDSGGGVPRVRWGRGGRELCVGWCGVGCRDPRLRARAAVSA